MPNHCLRFWFFDANEVLINSTADGNAIGRYCHGLYLRICQASIAPDPIHIGVDSSKHVALIPLSSYDVGQSFKIYKEPLCTQRKGYVFSKHSANAYWIQSLTFRVSPSKTTSLFVFQVKGENSRQSA